MADGDGARPEREDEENRLNRVLQIAADLEALAARVRDAKKQPPWRETVVGETVRSIERSLGSQGYAVAPPASKALQQTFEGIAREYGQRIRDDLRRYSGGVHRLVERMADLAGRRESKEIDVVDLEGARAQCGIIYICQPPPPPEPDEPQ